MTSSQELKDNTKPQKLIGLRMIHDILQIPTKFTNSIFLTIIQFNCLNLYSSSFHFQKQNLPMANTSIMVSTIYGVISFNWNLLGSASRSAPPTFVVRASWLHRPYHRSSPHHYVAWNLSYSKNIHELVKKLKQNCPFPDKSRAMMI